MLLKCHKLWRTSEPSPREFQPNYPWSNEDACYRLRVSSFLQACISLVFKRAADESGQALSFKILFEWLVQATIEWLKKWSQPSWCYSDINVRRRRRLFTCSVRWSPKESHTRRNFSLGGLRGKQNWELNQVSPRSQSFENDFRRQFRTISSNSQSHGKTSLFRNVWLEGNRTASTKFQSSNWGTREARMKSREWVIICAPTLCVTCARLVLISICLKNATNYACSEVWNSETLVL